MGILDLFRSKPQASTQVAVSEVTAPYADDGWFLDLTDPRLADLLRGGRMSEAGQRVSVRTAMRIPVVFRCVSLISNSIGMLPLHLQDKDTKENQTEHPLFKVLHRKPNPIQTAFDFRSNLQLRALTKGNGYAVIQRSRELRTGGVSKVVGLVPMDPDRVEIKQAVDWTLKYHYRRPDGSEQVFAAEEVFHLRGLSEDGICGISPVFQAADSIGLAIAAEQALGRLYRNGSFVNGYLSTSGRIGDDYLPTLRAQWESRFSGSENAGRTPILEEGLEYKGIGPNAKDSQSLETRKHQVEEILRVFGVPRPLAMVDETSWGSGIDALGQFFVRYALGPWFEAWEQAAARSLLSESEQDRLEAKFNPGGLLRGSMKDQADYFAKALGAGGTQPWMTPNEVRRVQDMPSHADGDKLENPMTAKPGGEAPSEGVPNNG